jgi:hypothetical protein
VIDVGGRDILSAIEEAVDLAEVLVNPARCVYPTEQVH